MSEGFRGTELSDGLIDCLVSSFIIIEGKEDVTERESVMISGSGILPTAVGQITYSNSHYDCGSSQLCSALTE